MNIESLPPEMLAYIAPFVPAQSYPDFLKSTKSFYGAGSPYIYEKRTQYLESRDRDPVIDAVDKNDLDYFKYLLSIDYPISWGALRRMILFDRKDFIRNYPFTVDTDRRIADILTILAYTGDVEMMELLKPRWEIPTYDLFPVYVYPNDPGIDAIKKLFNIKYIIYQTRGDGVRYYEIAISRLQWDILENLDSMNHSEIEEIIESDDPELFEFMVSRNPDVDDIARALGNTSIILTSRMARLIYEYWPEAFDKAASRIDLATVGPTTFETMLRTGWRPTPDLLNHIIANMVEFTPAPPEARPQFRHALNNLRNYNLISTDQYRQLRERLEL